MRGSSSVRFVEARRIIVAGLAAVAALVGVVPAWGQCTSGCGPQIAAAQKQCVNSLANESDAYAQLVSAYYVPPGASCTYSGTVEVSHATLFDLAPGQTFNLTHLCIGMAGLGPTSGFTWYVGYAGAPGSDPPPSGLAVASQFWAQKPAIPPSGHVLVTVNPGGITLNNDFWVIVTYKGTNTQLANQRTAKLYPGPVTGRAMVHVAAGAPCVPVWREYDSIMAPGYAGFRPSIRPLQLVNGPCSLVATPAQGLVTSETGLQAQFSVKLNKQPTAPVSVQASTSDATEGLPGPALMQFTSSNWNSPQTRLVTGQPDALNDGDQAYTITLSASSADPCFNGQLQSVQVVNIDSSAPAGTIPQFAWDSLGSTGPSARRHYAMDYDAARGRTVIFGGLSALNQLLNETWEFDGATWTQVTSLTQPPSARWGSAMVYDETNATMVLFGGNGAGGVSMNDIWTWNGASWSQITVTGSKPSQRGEHAMAYDAINQMIVLYGGRENGGTGAVKSDTWRFNGSSWVGPLLNGLPGQRKGHALAYDAARARTVLFGGYFSGGQSNGTYEWNGSTWALAPGAGPAAREQHAMTFDRLRLRTVLQGGFDGGTMFDDTWLWDGVSWVPQATTDPDRAMHRMAYDRIHKKLVMFGGVDSGGITRDQTWLMPKWMTTLAVGVTGTATGTAWSVTPVYGGVVTAPISIPAVAPGGSAAQIASALASALSSAGLIAQPVPGAPRVVLISSAGAARPRLFAGLPATPGVGLVPGGPGVSVNPLLEEIELSGADCDGNGMDDSIDIYMDVAVDSNSNGVPDSCDLPGTCAGACGGQAIGGCWCDEACVLLGDCCSDACATCPSFTPCDVPPPPCPPDLTGDSTVNVEDLLMVIMNWGACPDGSGADCPADLNADGAVSVNDLLLVINAWGPCPGGDA